MTVIKVLCTDGHERNIVKAIDTPTGVVFVDTLGVRIRKDQVLSIKHPKRKDETGS